MSKTTTTTVSEYVKMETLSMNRSAEYANQTRCSVPNLADRTPRGRSLVQGGTSVPGASVEEPRDMYLEIVKRAVRHDLYRPRDRELPPGFEGGFAEAVREAIRDGSLDMSDPDLPDVGWSWPKFGQTMVG